MPIIRPLVRGLNRSLLRNLKRPQRTLPSNSVERRIWSPVHTSSYSNHPCWQERRFNDSLQGVPRVRTPSSQFGSTNSLPCLKLQRNHFLGFGDGDEDSGLSKNHEESRVLGYSPEQLFSVVAAVDLYQDFVPWCQKSNILWQKESALEAELEIGFKFLVERYVSHVELKRPTLIKTTVSESNLFEYLTNIWEFKPGPIPGTCNLHFSVSFQFRSPLYGQIANMFFEEVVSRLVSSFENRCKMVYGPSVKVLEDTQAA